MAALIRRSRLLPSNLNQAKTAFSTSCAASTARRFFQVIPVREDENGLPSKAMASSALASLGARGFCRPMKPYKPADDVEDRVKAIYEDVLGQKADSAWLQTPITEPLVKFRLLTRCIKEFGHDIPNSQLMNVKCADDVVEFFSTPVEGLSPYELLVRQKDQLPKNLHVIPNYVRFHPETDTFFGGVNAYPGTSTIVTGLKAKKKYKGYVSSPTWPYTISSQN
uniref:Large ribosomal subunit protein mL50 n=1 Tax=Amblyomma parvum TaxID=251391 RepID=A0A023FRT7_AMBPA